MRERESTKFEIELAVLLNIIKAVSTSAIHKAISYVTKIGTVYLIIFSHMLLWAYSSSIISYRNDFILRNIRADLKEFRGSILRFPQSPTEVHREIDNLLRAKVIERGQ
jgi:hypothetical protein